MIRRGRGDREGEQREMSTLQSLLMLVRTSSTWEKNYRNFPFTPLFSLLFFINTFVTLSFSVSLPLFPHRNLTASWLVIQYEWAWLFLTGKERTLPLMRGRVPPSGNQTTWCSGFRMTHAHTHACARTHTDRHIHTHTHVLILPDSLSFFSLQSFLSLLFLPPLSVCCAPPPWALRVH